ncbi:MAG TPA: FHA domain-containing serine/threonine-protein kinase, partial [Fimbriiglobus sp.]
MDFPYFLVIAGQDKGRSFPVHPGSGHSMGRNQENAYVIKDMRCSRFHCEFAFENGQVTIKDRGGSGGTIVNGLPVVEQVLKHGDQIQVGETMLKFLTRGDDPTTVGPGVQSGNAEYDPKASEQLAELSGRTLARFELGQPLGTGSTSMVFRAKDTESGQAVALKVMQPAYAKNDEDMQRFVRAMKAMLPLRHPNLIGVYAAGKSGPYCWASLELVEGESLTAVIRRIGVAGMLDWKYAFRVCTHIARALDYAHGHGIIHRDIAPPNILVQLPQKVAKLGDLMLAKAIEGGASQQVTKPGEVVGDLNYMSPERTRGQHEAVDGRSDLFSLGATCYALLTGKSPFAGSTLVETITKIRSAEPLAPNTFQLGIP